MVEDPAVTNAAFWLSWMPTVRNVAAAMVAAGVVLEFAEGWISEPWRKTVEDARQLHIAQLERETAEAQLGLKKLRTDRVTLLTPEARAVILSRLTPFLGTKFDTGASGSSGEQADFLWEFRPLLQTAGWELVPWAGPGLPISFGNTGLPVMGTVAAQDVEIHVHPESRAQLGPAAAALVAALNEIGVPAIDRGQNSHQPKC
jgi:hypothetical protein